jgi:hypothetical protein
MKVRCIKLLDSMGEVAEHSAWARVGNVYHVLSISISPSQTRLCLIGDEPTPALFELDMFEIVSSTIPSVWVITSPKSGWFSLAPEPWSRPGFWEEFYDREPEAMACFEEYRKLIVASEP